MAIANIHRPGALTPTIVLSLGLGIALLVTVIEIDGNLRQQFVERTAGQGAVVLFPRYPGRPGRALRRLRARAGARRQSSKTCRCCAAASSRPAACRAENIKPRDDAAWVLQSDRGITYARRRAGRLAAGRRAMVGRRTTTGRRWFRSRSGSPTGSASSSATPSPSTCSAATSPRRIANMRTVDWQSLGINFVMVFSPNAFAGAPHTASRHADLSGRRHAGAGSRHRSARWPKHSRWSPRCGSRMRWKPSARSSPTWCSRIRGASAVTLLAAALVLGGALAAGHRHRVYDAVILKTLGATRRAPDRRLCDRIPAARRGHRRFRRAGRLARRPG